MMADWIATQSRAMARTKYQKIATALFRFYPAKRGVATISDFDGDMRIALDRSSYISSMIYWRGHHSLAIVRFLRDYLRPQMTFVDAGANIGEITLVAAKRLHEGKVLAFEPMPKAFARLSHNVRLNELRNVALFNVGLFDRSGRLPLYVKRDLPYGTCNDGVPSLFSGGSDREAATIPLRTFDAMAFAIGLNRLDVMKIDVEGAELMVLRGACGAIARFRPVVIIEISESNYRKAGYSANDLLAFFSERDYNVRSLHHAEGKLSSECDAVAFPNELSQLDGCR
jgi:FkbM family methyltransferase